LSQKNAISPKNLFSIFIYKNEPIKDEFSNLLTFIGVKNQINQNFYTKITDSIALGKDNAVRYKFLAKSLFIGKKVESYDLASIKMKKASFDS
jgi:hypothetical protein